MKGTSPRWRAPGRGLVERPDPAARERRLAIGLGLATLLSVAVVHRISWGSDWLASAAFALTLLGILALHELGHRVVAARHELPVSLPLFLPAPFWVGTLGAIIRIHGTPRSRTALLQTGASGPLVGLGAIAGAMILRLTLLPDVEGGQPLQQPLLWQGLAVVLRGGAVPLTTHDAVGFAAWVGCLVTALNLLPIGQLDGGHVAHAVSPDQASRVGWGTVAALVTGALVWWGWPVWALVLLAMGARKPLKVGDPGTPPDRVSRWMAAACVVAWGLCFTPVPW